MKLFWLWDKSRHRWTIGEHQDYDVWNVPGSIRSYPPADVTHYFVIGDEVLAPPPLPKSNSGGQEES